MRQGLNLGRRPVKSPQAFRADVHLLLATLIDNRALCNIRHETPIDGVL